MGSCSQSLNLRSEIVMLRAAAGKNQKAAEDLLGKKHVRVEGT